MFQIWFCLVPLPVTKFCIIVKCRFGDFHRDSNKSYLNKREGGGREEEGEGGRRESKYFPGTQKNLVWQHMVFSIQGFVFFYPIIGVWPL